MSADLAQDLGSQETEVLEFKREASDRRAIRKAICALANDLPGHGGGDLLIGVNKDGSPTGGVDTSDEALLALTNIQTTARSWTGPRWWSPPPPIGASPSSECG
jgi:ATP-dependent DNA helicase RecG